MAVRAAVPEWTRPVVAALVAFALCAGVLAVTVISTRVPAVPPATAPVYLEEAGAAGTAPFLDLAQPVPTPAGAEPADPVPPGSPGSGALGHCDPAALVAYLAAHRTAAQAWVGALNADPTLRWSGGSGVSVEQIPAYVAELSTVVLQDDARVTNHQFVGGSALAVQAVLQRGTAVLVDAAGVPRVRCACGNPLAPLQPIIAPARYFGTPWTGFAPIQVTVDVSVVDVDVDVDVDGDGDLDGDVDTRPRCDDHEYHDGDRCRLLVECPQGLYLGADGRCYFPADPCPPGWQRDDDGRCAAPLPPQEPCPQGSVRADDGLCSPTSDCPPGTVARENVECGPPPPPGCGDDTAGPGTCAPPAAPGCPATGERCAPPMCPDGTPVPSGGCTPPDACPDGPPADRATGCPSDGAQAGVPPADAPALVPAPPAAPPAVPPAAPPAAPPAVPPAAPPAVPPHDPPVVPPVDPPVERPVLPAGPPVDPPRLAPPAAPPAPPTPATTVEAPVVAPDVPPTCPPGMFPDNGSCSACPVPSPDLVTPEGCRPTAHGRRRPRKAPRQPA